MMTENNNMLFYYLMIKRYKPLSHKEEIECGKLIYEIVTAMTNGTRPKYDIVIKEMNENRKDALAALHKLIRHNLRFVFFVAQAYTGQGIATEDVVGVGNEGLIRAACYYNPYKGFKFISYAVWWIRQAILQYFAQNSRIVKIPLNKVSIIEKIMNANSQAELDEIKKKYRITPENYADIMLAMKTPIRIDQQIPYTDDLTYTNKIVSESNTAEKAEENSKTAFVNKYVEELDERDQKIIRLYFGLNGSDRHTLESIASILGLTRERVRQVKEMAMDKLKKKMALDKEIIWN